VKERCFIVPKIASVIPQNQQSKTLILIINFKKGAINWNKIREFKEKENYNLVLLIL